MEFRCFSVFLLFAVDPAPVTSNRQRNTNILRDSPTLADPQDPFWSVENLRKIAANMAQNNPQCFANVVAALNEMAVAPEFTSIRDLDVGKRYEVRYLEKIPTQYGEKIKAELVLPGASDESIFVILPT
ncbi:dITP/XTP pyrophosphatase [Frankliniella fusca]|uniref:DITP/XTP pyrophosphatase n=1 Tax=Frankliniella fusca TaxID=407009 RepID=A0AAE1LTZ5_9NEOP|nr:dITP/XTP pyrophosphatase [Frankliniella fusca]